MTSYKGKLLKADFTEDNVSVAVQSLLSTLSFPLRPFTLQNLSKSRERYLGADAKLYSQIRGFRPFYMQFKCPSAYPAHSRSGIVSDRESLGATIDPHSLFFRLREKKRQQRDFQHNHFYRLRQRLVARSLGEAAYICPLFLDFDTYLSAAHRAGILHRFAIWRRHPWILNEIVVETSAGRFQFDDIPILGAHVAIPPHVEVSTAAHYYSFSDTGTDLCFHEPTRLPEGSFDFPKFLSGVGARFLEADGRIEPGQDDEKFFDLVSAVYGETADTEGFGEDPVGRWLDFGYRLQRDFGIVQFAFIDWNLGDQ